jgi:hypothetical protein
METHVSATESERLRAKIELFHPYLAAASRRFVDDPRLTDLYPEYLFATHCVIRASVPLMETASGRAREIAEDDPVAAQLAGYLEEHIHEELNHDEWLLDDLEALGRPRSGILARPPAARVASLVGAQYYWINHYHPVSLLGYIAVLEGYPPSIEAIDVLMRRTGYDRDAFRTLIAHAELDPGHGDDLNELLDRLPLTPDQSTAIGLAATFTVQTLAGLYDDIVRFGGAAES